MSLFKKKGLVGPQEVSQNFDRLAVKADRREDSDLAVIYRLAAFYLVLRSEGDSLRQTERSTIKLAGAELKAARTPQFQTPDSQFSGLVELSNE